MNDEISSPQRKKLRQTSIMESLSKSLSTGVATPSSDHCAVVIEPEEELKANSGASLLTESQSFVRQSTLEVHEAFLLESNVEVSTYSNLEELKCWRGKPLPEMRSLLSSPVSSELLEIIPSRSHMVLFKVPLVTDSVPVPYPARHEDKWDGEHVKMPCSPNSLYPVIVNGMSSLEQRWNLIKEAYQKKIENSLELEKAILSYNSRYNKIWDFKGLHAFTSRIMSSEEKQKFFNFTLPGIIELAMRLPERVTRPPVLLVRQKAQSVSLSQSQITSLLANAFLSTFPRRNTQKRQSEFSTYPDINFNRLLENKSKSNSVYEKLRCILHYFDRVIKAEPTGVVTFTRQVVNEQELPDWLSVQNTFKDFHVSSNGTIENEGVGLLQMDFANKYIGGGVLNYGCVQEEIRFVVCPELLVSCLFCEVMDNNEAILITGCEQYCSHSGYGDSFRYKGDFVDTTPRDTYGRRLCRVVAVDATCFHRAETQYQKAFLRRELNKAYAGFYSPRREETPLVAVATGNWGCGAFGGDARLKCLVQLMAASVTERDVVYFTFGDEQLRDDVFNMYTFLVEKNITVGSLYSMLCQYSDDYSNSRTPSLDLYGYLYAVGDTLDANFVCTSDESYVADVVDDEEVSHTRL